MVEEGEEVTDLRSTLPSPILKPGLEPDLNPVPYKPIQNTPQNLLDKLWQNRFNLIRHFIMAGSAVAGATWTSTHDISTTAWSFLIGGVTGAARKGVDDISRSDGKSDMVTAAIGLITRKKLGGDTMIRDEVIEAGDAFADLALAIFNKDEDDAKSIMSAMLGLLKEGGDVVQIPKEDRMEGAAHALTLATAKVVAAKVTYSDEVPETPPV